MSWDKRKQIAMSKIVYVFILANINTYMKFHDYISQTYVCTYIWKIKIDTRFWSATSFGLRPRLGDDQRRVRITIYVHVQQKTIAIGTNIRIVSIKIPEQKILSQYWPLYWDRFFRTNIWWIFVHVYVYPLVCYFNIFPIQIQYWYNK